MKVADLQKTLRELAQLFESAGGTKPVGELRAFAEGLDKFKEQTLNSFTTLLGRMSETGEVAAKTPKAPKVKQSAAPKPPPVDVGALATETRHLFDRAPQGIDEIELVALRERLARLTVPSLTVVAKELSFTPTSKEKAKAALLDAILRKIEKREGATIRRNVIDRPRENAPANGVAGPVDGESVSSTPPLP